MTPQLDRHSATEAGNPNAVSACLFTRNFPSVVLAGVLLLVAHLASANAADLSIVGNVELQPLGVSVRRVAQALEWEGSPLSETERAALEKAIESGNGDEAVD